MYTIFESYLMHFIRGLFEDTETLVIFVQNLGGKCLVKNKATIIYRNEISDF